MTKKIKYIIAAAGTAIYDLSFLIDNKASFDSDGSFTLSPLTINSSSELTGLELQKGWPYLAGLLTAPVKGTLDVAGDVVYDQSNGLTAQNGSLKIKNFLTRYGQKGRIFLKNEDVFKAPEKEAASRSRVELNIIAQ